MSLARICFTFLFVCTLSACVQKKAAPAGDQPAKDPFLADNTPVDEVLEIRTVPSGANVKLSTGESCKSPCRVTKKSTDTLDVRIEKQGYRAQVVTVVSHARVIPGSGADGVPELERPRLTPNPVNVTLEPSWSKR